MRVRSCYINFKLSFYLGCMDFDECHKSNEVSVVGIFLYIEAYIRIKFTLVIYQLKFYLNNDQVKRQFRFIFR